MRRDVAAGRLDRPSRQLLIGEFGTFHLAAPDERAARTGHVRATADDLGIPWCYWDFATDFGLYDTDTCRWNEPLHARPALTLSSIASTEGQYRTIPSTPPRAVS